MRLAGDAVGAALIHPPYLAHLGAFPAPLGR